MILLPHQDIINFNDLHRDIEFNTENCCQETLVASVQTTGKNTTIYLDARAADVDIGSTRGIDAVLDAYGLDALVLPTEGYASAPAAIVRETPFPSSHLFALDGFYPSTSPSTPTRSTPKSRNEKKKKKKRSKTKSNLESPSPTFPMFPSLVEKQRLGTPSRRFPSVTLMRRVSRSDWRSSLESGMNPS